MLFFLNSLAEMTKKLIEVYNDRMNNNDFLFGGFNGKL